MYRYYIFMSISIFISLYHSLSLSLSYSSIFLSLLTRNLFGIQTMTVYETEALMPSWKLRYISF